MIRNVSISQAKWDNLQKLNFCSHYLIEEYNIIGAVGCEYLSKANLDNLQKLNFYSHYLIAKISLLKIKLDLIESLFN